MKRFWQSKTHWFSVVGLPAASYALLNIDNFGLAGETAALAGLGLTVTISLINIVLRQVTEKAIG